MQTETSETMVCQNGSANAHPNPAEATVVEQLPHSQQWIPKRRMTVMAVIVATLGSFGLGMTLVWSAIALKYLKEDKPLGEINSLQESLIGSIIYLGALISAPLSGLLIQTIGRKQTMLISALPCFIGWMLIAFAVNVEMIYLGRFITGFCGGSFTVAVPAYVSEVTEDRIRGTLGTVMILMLVCGIEFTFIVGAFVDWFWLSIVAASVPVIFFIFMIFMPESPRYLIIKRQPSAARRALKWLRRASTKRHIEPEMSQIENSVTTQQTGQGRNQPSKSCTLSDLTSPGILKPIGISITLLAFSQFSGMNGISLYTSDVFSKAGTEMPIGYALIIIWGAQALSVLFVTFFLVENFGRKTLMLASSLGMILGLIGFGLSFHVQIDNRMPEGWSWLPLTALVTFIIGYNVGMGPIPWVIITEILPPHGRELTSSIVTFFYWALSFIAGITFIPLEKLCGNTILYLGCSGVTALAGLFVILLVPESKGKSSEEIQKYFRGGSQSRKANKDVELQNENEFRNSATRRKDEEGFSNPGFDEVDIQNNS